MLDDLREHALQALWPALTGALLSIGLVLPLLSALNMSGSGAAIFASLYIGLCCAVSSLGGRRYRLIALGMGGVFVFFLLVTGQLSSLSGMLSAAVGLINLNIEPLRAYGPQIALLFAVLFTLIGHTIARQNAGFYPALSLVMVVLVFVWLLGSRERVYLFAPALIALCMMFARSHGEHTPQLRVMLASLLVVVLALMISPSLQFVSTEMEDRAEWLRSYITDRYFFSGERRAYSIAQDGFKPLQTRLGGPVELEDRPVMTVQTERSLLLRGVVYNEYNALNWISTVARESFLYSSRSAREVRAETLGEDLPTESLRQSSLFATVNAQITMQSASASTLFVPLRVETLTLPTEMVLYFNRSSELYTTRDLAPGDSYTVSAPDIHPADPRLPDLLRQASASVETPRDMTMYLRLPEGIADDVYALAHSITSAVSSPLDKALAIQSHLQASYRYTLTPETPPNNVDFVSYFLLRGREGYCTYFASAMAVLARMVGLPTRYVEGYIAEPMGGVALVTSKKAHAWAEVYFEGFGWIAFDATPPESRGGPRSDTSLQAPQNTTQNDPSSETYQAEADPEASPTPDPEEGAPAGGEGGDTPDDSFGDNTPEPTDTPAPDSTLEPEESSSPEEAEIEQSRPPRSWGWLLWLLVLAAIALAVWQGMRTRPEAIALRHPMPSEKLLVWYKAILGLLACAQMPAKSHETPVSYAQRIEQGIPTEAGFLSVAKVVSFVMYARYEVQPEAVQAARQCYQAIWHHVPLKARLKWLTQRMLKGIGRLDQVP